MLIKRIVFYIYSKLMYPPDQLHLAKPTCIADFCGKITT
jgi:hypothetical protein